MNKIIPWWHPVLGEREKELIGKVIDSQFPNHGKVTMEFERQVAEICQVPYAVAVTSCTAGLVLSLKAAGVGPGDEVIIPDITFMATANAVSLAGATPVIVDVREDNLTIDVSKTEKAITSKTKAIIPVHLSGRAAAIEDLQRLCENRNIFLIEDVAEAFGSSYKHKPLGSFGFTGCLSFTATKLVTTGQGGAVVMSNEETYYKIRALRDHGRPNRGSGGNDIHDFIGYNFKFTDLQAAVGIAQLETLQQRLMQQQKLYQFYKESLEDDPRVRLLPFNTSEGESPLWIDAVAENRDALIDYLTQHGAETRKFWYPIHTQKPYLQPSQNYPISTQMTPQAFWLPSALSLTLGDAASVCILIKEFYQSVKKIK